jgi:polysaccharide export outer membrane protein
MRASRLILLSLVVAALAVSGCMRRPGPPMVAAPVLAEPTVIAAPAVMAAPGVPIIEEPVDGPYLLDSGDKLRVVVFGQENLSNSYSVNAAGRIDMPLIGTVEARAQTTAGLAGAISAKLRNGYIREPHVAVEVEAYRPFFILGEVTAPGQYPYVAHMSVETAVAIAGGFTPRAYKKTVVLSRPVYGELYRGKVPLTYQLLPGDTIVVSERWF